MEIEQVPVGAGRPDCDPVDAVARILQSRCGARMKVGLLLVLEGASYRAAARRAGLRECRFKDLWRNAARLRVTGLHKQRLAQREAERLRQRLEGASTGELLGVLRRA